jgi:regulatory protein
MIEIHTPKQVAHMGNLASPPPILAGGFTITVRYLRAQNTGESICICVDLTDTLRNLTEVRRYTVQTELLAPLNVRRGVISQEKLEEIEQMAQLSAAYTRALSILAYGANSAHALTLKLRQRGFDAETADRAITFLRERGYLREENDALREAERCLNKGWGRKRIELYLRQRGYSSEAAAMAIDELGDIDDEARCSAVARRKSPTPPADQKEKQKLIAYLLRQGYDMSIIRHALEYTWQE